MTAPLVTAAAHVSVLKTMTAEELVDFKKFLGIEALQALQMEVQELRMEVQKLSGIEETGAKPQAAAPAADAKPKKAGRPKKVAPAPVSLPVAVAGNDEEAPEADAYRLSPEKIQEDLCQGRRLDDQDRRWKPSVYREVQCSGKPAAGSDLCATCAKRQAKYAEDDSPKVNWHGRITDEPFGWAHMLGTTWADEKKPKWMGSAASSASASVVADDSDAASEASAPAAAGAGSVKANKAAEKEAAKAAKEAEKAAAKAAKEAEKAEKEAAKAAKEAEKAAAKAAKEAEKEAAKAAKEAKKPAAKKPAAKQVPAKADTGAEVAETAGAMRIIDGTEYWVLPNGNVHDYDSATEQGGVFVGRLTEDGSLDSDADELTE